MQEVRQVRHEKRYRQPVVSHSMMDPPNNLSVDASDSTTELIHSESNEREGNDCSLVSISMKLYMRQSLPVTQSH